MKKGLFLFAATALIAIFSFLGTNLSFKNYKLIAGNDIPVVINPPIHIDGMKTTPVIIRQKSTVKISENLV
jgi:hypothetical protein